MFRLGTSGGSSKIPVRRSVEARPRRTLRIGRNDPCPCSSGKKYKHCHESEGEEYLIQLYREHETRRKEALDKQAGVSWFRRLLHRALR